MREHCSETGIAIQYANNDPNTMIATMKTKTMNFGFSLRETIPCCISLTLIFAIIACIKNGKLRRALAIKFGQQALVKCVICMS